MPVDMKSVANDVAAEILRIVRPDLTIAHDPDKDMLTIHSADGGFVLTRKMIDDNRHISATQEGYRLLAAREKANELRQHHLQHAGGQATLAGAVNYSGAVPFVVGAVGSQRGAG